MIDLKLLREDPDRVRASQRARGEDPALVDALLDADATRRAAISTADNLRAEQKAASKLVGAASADDRPALLARAKELADGSRPPKPTRPPPKSRSPPRTWRSSNVIIDGVPAGGEDDFVVLDTVGEPACDREPEGPPRTRRGARPDRHGARRQGVGLALLLPHRVRRPAAARPAAAGGPAGDRERLHPRHPARAGAPGGHVRHRFPRCARRRDLPARGRRHVSRWHVGGSAGRLPLRRDPRPVRRAAALRGLVVVLPPRGGQLRQGHPRHHPRAPVRQGRGLRLLQAGGRRGRASAAARLAARDARPDRGAVSRDRHRRRRSRLVGRPQVRLRGVGADAGHLPRADVDVELHARSRRGGCPPATATRTASRRPRRRSTARWPPPAGWSPSWRTTSSRTAASGSRKRWCPTSEGRC